MAKDIKRVDVIWEDEVYDMAPLVYTAQNDGEGFIQRAKLEFMDEARFHFVKKAGMNPISLEMVIYEDEAGKKEFMKLHQPLLEPHRFSADWEALLEREERFAETELDMWLNGYIEADYFELSPFRQHGAFAIL